MRAKGQVSMEILIVLAILIVIGVAFGVYYINNLNKNISDIEENDQVSGTVENFVDTMNQDENMTVEIRYDGTNTCTAVTRYNQGTVTCNWGSGTFGECNTTCTPGTSISVTAKDYRGFIASTNYTP